MDTCEVEFPYLPKDLMNAVATAMSFFVPSQGRGQCCVLRGCHRVRSLVGPRHPIARIMAGGATQDTYVVGDKSVQIQAFNLAS